jgi:uroporphyrinogen-III decarboxylase
MLDLAEDSPEVRELIALVERYWFEVARRWVEAGADVVSFGDDLGLQHALPISPDAWRRFIGPAYRRIFQYCRSHGVQVHLHSDGYVLDIIPDLIDWGVTILNVQDLVNGLANLRRLAWGKVYLDLDVDRQNVTVFGTPEEVDAHILESIRTLGSPQGGLSLIWGVYPGTPLANIEAAVQAMGKYATIWQPKG